MDTGGPEFSEEETGWKGVRPVEHREKDCIGRVEPLDHWGRDWMDGDEASWDEKT